MNFTLRSIALGFAFGIAGCAQGAFVTPGNGGASLLPNVARVASPLGRMQRQTGSSGPQIYVFQALPDAQTPEVGIVNIGKTLYGTTYYGGASNDGALYSVTTSGAETVMHSFPTGSGDGYNPDAALTAVKGTLYGTTYYGGAYGAGTIFAITPSGSYKVLYSFGASAGDAESPDTALTYVPAKGALYAVAYHGGTDGEGCIYKYSLGTKPKESVVYSFTGASNSPTDASSIVFYNNAFYGTTPGGGANGDGSVFKVTLSGTESLVYSFKEEPDGAHPYAGLTLLGNAFYGVTHDGGQGACGGYGGCGVIFKVAPGGKETVLYRFVDKTNVVDGGGPVSAMIALKGTLYGTAPCTGPRCSSVIFSEKPSGGHDNIVYDFISIASDPAGYPLSTFYGSPLPLNGTFYGTSATSAKSGYGTVWAVPE